MCDLHTCCLCNISDYDIEYHYCPSGQFGCPRYVELLDIPYQCEEGVCHGETLQGGTQYVWSVPNRPTDRRQAFEGDTAKNEAKHSMKVAALPVQRAVWRKKWES